MAVAQYQLIFNCTLAQFTNNVDGALASLGFNVTHAPIKATGIVQSGTFTFNATSAAASTALTAISSLAGLVQGLPVAGANLAPGTTLADVGAVNTATLSANATATGAFVVTATPASNGQQIDFAYDGNAFLTFFGSNMTPALISQISASLNALLGAPIAVNLANNPSNAANA